MNWKDSWKQKNRKARIRFNGESSSSDWCENISDCRSAAFFAGINDRIKGKDFEEILPELEKEAGEKIDLLFGAPVSEKFFKITSPFTVLESGETFAEQIITVIGGIIEKELEAREKAQQERVRKYIAKYTKEESKA